MGGPWPGGVGRDPGEMNPPGSHFDDEQDVEPAQECGIDAREVGRDDPCCLGADELHPRRAIAVTGGVDVGGSEDLPHGGCCDGVSKSGEFAVESTVAPAGVLAGESDDEFADFGFHGWPPAPRGWWLSPESGDESTMPADHCLWPDDDEDFGEASTVEHAGEHREDRPVGLGEFGSFDLALEDDELMAQREDFGVTLVAGGEHPSEARQDEFREGGERVHGSATVSGQALETPRIFAQTH